MTRTAPLSAQEFGEIVRAVPLVSIDLIVRDEHGHVLVGCRQNEPAKDTFFVPGGRIRKDETIAAAFQRIMTNELGVSSDINEARFVGVFEHFYPTNFREDHGYGTHYVVLAYELTLARALAIKPDNQHSVMQWMTPAALMSSSDVHPNTKAYVR